MIGYIKWAERKIVSIIFFFPMILHVKNENN